MSSPSPTPQPPCSPTFPPYTLTRICTVSSPSPASRASMVNSTGRLAGIPPALSPGPLARTLLASWEGSAVTLKGLREAGSQEGAGISGLYGDPVSPRLPSLGEVSPAWHLLPPVLDRHGVGPVGGWGVSDLVGAVTIVSDVHWLRQPCGAVGHVGWGHVRQGDVWDRRTWGV